MSTHVPGFQSFFQCFLYYFVMAKLATSSIRVKIQATEGASGKMCICVLVKSRMLTSGQCVIES